MTQIFEKLEGYHLAQVGRKISETVDFEKSGEERRTVILPGVDEHVDRIMQNAGLEKELAEAEGKAMEKRKASGGEVINNGGS